MMAGLQQVLAGSDVAKEARDHPLRQAVGLDPIGHGRFLQFRHKPPVTANDAFEDPVMAEVVEPPLLAVTLPCRVHQSQVARSAKPLPVTAPAGKKALVEGNGAVLGKADADEAAGGDGVAVTNQAHRLGGGGGGLAGIRGAQRRSHGMGRARHALYPARDRLPGKDIRVWHPVYGDPRERRRPGSASATARWRHQQERGPRCARTPPAGDDRDDWGASSTTRQEPATTAPAGSAQAWPNASSSSRG